MDEPSYDYASVYAGVLVTIVAVGLAYGGVRGFWLYAHHSGSDAADPAVSTLALIAAPWLAGLARKLVRRHPASQPLLSRPELLICSLGAIAGAVWSVIGGFPHPGFILGGIGSGIGGLFLWWRRYART